MQLWTDGIDPRCSKVWTCSRYKCFHSVADFASQRFLVHGTSTASSAYFFVYPYNSLALPMANLVPLGIFVVTSAFVVLPSPS